MWFPAARYQGAMVRLIGKMRIKACIGFLNPFHHLRPKSGAALTHVIDLAKIAVLAGLTLSLIAGSIHAGESSVRIAFLISDSLKSTVRTISGARKVIKRNHPTAEFSSFVLNTAELESASLTAITG